MLGVGADYLNWVIMTAVGLGAASPVPVARQLQSPERYTLEDEFHVWNWVHEALGDDGGLKLAECVQPGAFELIDYLIRNSRTLAEMIEQFQKYHRLFSDGYRLVMRPRGDSIRTLTQRLVAGDPLLRCRAEFAIGARVLAARQLTQGRFSADEITFRHGRGQVERDYDAWFAAPVRFNAPTDSFLARKSMLQLAVSDYDIGLRRLLEGRADSYLKALPPRGDFLEDIRAAMRVLNASGENVTAETISHALRLTERTLLRRLKEFNTSVRELRDEMLRDLAHGYLASEAIPLADISGILGYSDPTAFHRAVKRWHGCTPAQLRERLSSAPPPPPDSDTPSNGSDPESPGTPETPV